MSLAPEKLDALMILVCAVALVILLALAIYTWVKWHRQQTRSAGIPNEPPPSDFELTGMKPYPAAHFQESYLNEVGRESPNLSGSRTFLDENVLKQKPFSKDNSSPGEFQTKDVIYHANTERNLNQLLSGDVVFHTNGPFGSVRNNTANEVDAGNDAINSEEPNEKRRWSESMTLSGDREKVEVSHRKNTYL